MKTLRLSRKVRIWKTRSWAKRTAMAMSFLTLAVMPATTALAGSQLDAAFDGSATFQTMNEAEMASARGGYRGVSFGVYFSGSVSSSNNNGDLPPGMTLTQDGDNRVQLQASLGDLGGANGLFQFTNVVGDMNVVNNSIVINIMVVPDLPSDVAAAWR